MKPRIAIVGVGHMGRSALSILARHDAGLRFVAIDRDDKNLSDAAAIGACVGETRRLDLLRQDPDFTGCDLVLNFAGPFFSGSDVVARAALAARVPYVDVGDDVEATRAILALDQEARSAGVPLITGAGLSPGVSNWLAVQLLAANPDCDEIKVVWVTHEPDPGGLAPLRHMLHMAVVPCPVWREGRMADSPGFAQSTAETFEFPEPFGCIEALDTSHPEPLTLSRAFPGLRGISCKGALRPDWANAAFSALGKIGFGYHDERVAYGDMEIESAEFLWRLMWQRHRRRPARESRPATGVMVMGLRDGTMVESRSVIDDGDMSRGTGLGAASAALSLLNSAPEAGAAGVEALNADAGIGYFLELARAQQTFVRGVIIAR